MAVLHCVGGLRGCSCRSNPTSRPLPAGGSSESVPLSAPGCGSCLSAAELRLFSIMELRYSLVFLSFILPLCTAGSPWVLEPYDILFDTAVDAYNKGDWLTVILNMEKAIRNKAMVRNVKAQCRLSCANNTAFGEPVAGLGVPVPGAGSVDDLGFFQKILKRADCVNSCETEKLGSRTFHLVSEEVKLEFKKRTPYNYLQVAYFKINKLDKAVAAAHTFFLANPDHMEMRQNLEYYRMMAGVQQEDFKDLEARPYMAYFLDGKSYYSHDSFGLAAENFEAGLDEYFTADKECRALCEGAYNYDGYNYMEYSADLFQTLTDHYMQVLSCKQHCSVELASTAGRDKPFEDFLASQFNYLQFSYYNSEKYEKAIECARTFLLFYPNDVVMNQNLAYYSVVVGEDKAVTITARQVVKQYIQNSLLEKELLYFGYEAFGITFVDPDSWTPEEVMPKKLRDKQKADKETAARITEEIGNLMKEIETMVEEKKKDSSDMNKIIVPEEDGALLSDGIKLTMTSQQLNGTQRVLLDGVISDEECRELQRLSNAAAMKGDGYRGSTSPHSPSEMFQGVTVLNAVKLGQEGKVPLKSARLFFDLSERVRKVLESYFQLDTPLYFAYSHLVCRSAIDEKQKEREDLSHPVHADNCLLVSEHNECIKEPPAYTHRDYSAILYLNHDFEGGDFIFTELDAKTVTAEVRPQCGRVVGFGAGKENPHGVKAVTQGQRCAVALWFTLDPAHEEKERIQAQDLLKMFSTPLNTEFSKKEATESSEPQPATPEPPPAQAAQETADGKQDDKPAEQKVEAQADKPAEQKVEAQADKPAEQKVEAQADKPAEQKVEAQADKPAEQKVEAQADKLAEQKVEVQADKPTEQKVEAQADKPAEQKVEAQADKPTEQKVEAQADKPADTPKDKSETKPVSQTTTGAKAKAAPKAKAKAGEQVKDKKTVKGKAAAKTDGKQTIKTQTKQSDKKDTKPAAKKTVKVVAKKDSKKAKAPGTSASDSQNDREEL
ncbi:prolyl 3-hydroxylase 1 isoform X6 [Hippoglossus hippoglossus]|uniref:prolyl 3-hydroxylase 1 isoform X5 n=1 Tax=Hippoglossus hippoglossus TaxID=8267 RepID=UPI00148C1DF6|nr:prolyl 3-hydroxylase 1 isoform X5 [Hippoglossus hippoglossus]XP_034441828.1 prolyl 3-hydroxylase 1 isoform X6 [Hippoglossus hippoglossus]